MTKRPIAVWIATVGGVGFSPWAPGTMGSLVGLFIWVPIFYYGPSVAAGMFLVLVVLGTWASGHAAIALGQKDPSAVVIDEVVGMGVALWGAPLAPLWILAAFGFFRLWDIRKPYPLKGWERLPGGLGIMSDDIGAGIYAALCLHIVLWLVQIRV